MSFRNATQLKELPKEIQVQVLNIYEKTFKDSACRTACDGNCCSRCAVAEGFFGGRMPGKVLNELKAKFEFNDKDGFRGPTGCKLPLEERNDICLSFMCSGQPASPPFTIYGPHKEMPFSEEQRDNGYKISEAFWMKTEEDWRRSVPGKTTLGQVWPSSSPSKDADSSAT